MTAISTAYRFVRRNILGVRPKLINVYRMHQENLGDRQCSPKLYFDFLQDAEEMDILPYHTARRDNIYKDIRDHVVILGGGGILMYDRIMKQIASSGARAVVLWGAGHNNHGESALQGMPDYLKKFTLAGIRDVVPGYDWVPCPSCMHPAFSREYAIKHDYVIYEHAEFPIHPSIPGPRITNYARDFNEVIAFLASGETVLTNSYHGAYWATLLNRKVMVVDPFSSKFYGFKHKLPVVAGEEWKTKLKECRSYPEALRECRELN
ncbi:MAG TPA: hypothetical protein VL688_11705, partial [Verrucomicrobiae bacterium]|nr:hypothetical protein [Verrucomicrobiae bacterium]